MRDKACKFPKNRGEEGGKIWGQTHDKNTGIFSRDVFRAFAGLRPAFRALRPASRALLPASRASGQRPGPAASVHSLRPAFRTSGQRSQGCGQRSQPAASIQHPPAALSTQRQHPRTLPGMHGRCRGRPAARVEAVEGKTRARSPGPGGASRGRPRDPGHGACLGPCPGGVPRDSGARLGAGPGTALGPFLGTRGHALGTHRGRSGALPRGSGACLGHAPGPFWGTSSGLGGVPWACTGVMRGTRGHGLASHGAVWGAMRGTRGRALPSTLSARGTNMEARGTTRPSSRPFHRPVRPRSAQVRQVRPRAPAPCALSKIVMRARGHGAGGGMSFAIVHRARVAGHHGRGQGTSSITFPLKSTRSFAGRARSRHQPCWFFILRPGHPPKEAKEVWGPCPQETSTLLVFHTPPGPSPQRG